MGSIKRDGLYHFVLSYYPTQRSGIRNQSGGLISTRRRYALLPEMLVTYQTVYEFNPKPQFYLHYMKTDQCKIWLRKSFVLSC